MNALFRRGALALASLAASAGAGAQRLGGGGATVELSWWRILGALFICLLLAGLVILLLRHRGGAPLPRLLQIAPAPGASIRILERRPLGYRQEVVRLVADGRTFVLVIGPHQPVLLHSELDTVRPQ